MNKNKKQLESFVEYCNQFPEQRFFQALRNWYADNYDKKVNYILTAELAEGSDGRHYKNIQDTFYE